MANEYAQTGEVPAKAVEAAVNLGVTAAAIAGQRNQSAAGLRKGLEAKVK